MFYALFHIPFPLTDEPQTIKPKKKKKSKEAPSGSANPAFAAATGQVASTATTTGTETQVDTSGLQQRSYEAPKVEELGDDE